MATAPARQNPSFFRVLAGEFQSKLRIPTAFVECVFKGEVPTEFTLNSFDSEGSWQVSVGAELGNHFFIGPRWSKFVDDYGLEMGEFLFFFYVGDSTFDVITYRDSCSKNIILAAENQDAVQPSSVNRQTEQTPTRRCSSPVPNKEEEIGDSSTGNVREEVVFARKRERGQSSRQVEEPPRKNCAPSSSKRAEDLISSWRSSFDLVLKGYQQYNTIVPKVFAKEMGLAEEPITVIKGSDGRKWPIKIMVDERSYVRFSAGWSKFLEDNKVKVGDTISFWHIPNSGNVINFEITCKAGDGN